MLIKFTTTINMLVKFFVYLFFFLIYLRNNF